MSLTVDLIPIFNDNYVFLLVDSPSQKTSVVDPGDGLTVAKYLDKKNIHLDQILITHHHPDHIDGVDFLRDKYHCEVIGAEKDRHRLPSLTTAVSAGDTVVLGSAKGQVQEIPGHTLGHIAYWFESENMLFSGDTLFSLGCGRLFEGSPAQMWQSLKLIMAMPDNTQIYCTHEYTLANGRFAISVDPNNSQLIDFLAQAQKLREQNQPTVPTLLGTERAINPFLRPLEIHLPSTPKPHPSAILPPSTPMIEAFAHLRRLKDNFK